jgi:hypothetical protein
MRLLKALLSAGLLAGFLMGCTYSHEEGPYGSSTGVYTGGHGIYYHHYESD